MLDRPSDAEQKRVKGLVKAGQGCSVSSITCSSFTATQPPLSGPKGVQGFELRYWGKEPACSQGHLRKGPQHREPGREKAGECQQRGAEATRPLQNAPAWNQVAEVPGPLRPASRRPRTSHVEMGVSDFPSSCIKS